MRVYRACWCTGVLLTGWLAFTVAVLAVPPVDLVGSAFVGVLVGLAGCLLVAELAHDPAAAPPLSAGAVLGPLVLVAGAGAQAVVGGSAVLLVGVLCLLSSPAACRVYGVLLEARRRPAVSDERQARQGVAVRVTAETVRRLSDAELAALWEHSAGELLAAERLHHRAGWLLARQACLDEFERRAPGQFAQWLVDAVGTTPPSVQPFPRLLDTTGRRELSSGRRPDGGRQGVPGHAPPERPATPACRSRSSSRWRRARTRSCPTALSSSASRCRASRTRA